MLSIGEFSRVTSLTVKTLRYYHELGLIEPEKIDDFTGYRYYSKKSVERAKQIIFLKDLGFTLNEIKSVFKECNSEKEFMEYIENKIKELKQRIEKLSDINTRLEHFKEYTKPEQIEKYDIKETVLEPMLICGIRIKGKYELAGKAVMELMRKCGTKIKGKPMCFYYDMEYKEDDANFITCFELKKEIEIPGVEVLKTDKYKCVKLLHKGPFGTQGLSYNKLFDYCHKKNYKIKPPTIEHYIRGPGMVFRGNPENYLTEIMLIAE